MIEFRGYAYTRTPSPISGGLVTTYDPKTPQIWRVPLRDQVSVSISATVPLGGYVVPAAFAAEIARPARRPRRRFSRLRGAAERFKAQAFRATEVRFSAAPFEGRMRAQLTGAWHEETYAPAGWRALRANCAALGAVGGGAFRAAGAGLLRRVGLVQCLLRTEGAHGTLCRRADRAGNARPRSAPRRGILRPVRARCRHSPRDPVARSGVLLAPARIVGRAIQPISGAADGGKSGIEGFATGAAGRRRKCSDVRM